MNLSPNWNILLTITRNLKKQREDKVTARNHCKTASKAHDVMSRMVTYRRNFDETDFISVIDKVSDKTYFFIFS